jgi:dihydropteroate synthase
MWHRGCDDVRSMFVARPNMTWQLRTRSLEVGARTLVMAVVNLTPDSFSDGGSYPTTEAAVERCMQCLDEGADILDLGAESTRPGSHAGSDAAVSAEQEQMRLLPVMEAVRRAAPRAVLSVDTYKAFTARVALEAGAEIINDVSGFTWDADVARVCAEARCGVVLMHTRGRPDEWRAQPRFGAEQLVSMAREGLAESLFFAEKTGIARDAVVLDPGYGFGKRFDENFSLLARQDELLSLGRPLLAGLSRKSFLGHALAEFYEGQGAPVGRRENAGVAAMVTAILNGAYVVRVHDVRPAVEAARIADAVLAGR